MDVRDRHFSRSRSLSPIALRSIGTTTVSAQITDDQIAAPEATTVITGNLAPITINDNSTASLYPSVATVSGQNQSITRVRVQLNGFAHTFPDDVDIILEGPQGQRAMVMSDAGGGGDVSDVQLTFDSAAPLSAVLPDSALLTTGDFRAANYGNTAALFTDTFPAPFPAPNTLTDAPADLSVFHQTNPNGTWRLYVVDDAGDDVGTISGGWTLVLTVPAIFTVNSTNDPGNGVCDGSECTLREAITAAINAPNNSDQISFDPSFITPKTIDLLTPLPDITESMAIVGPGANLLTVRRSFNAATDFRIFNIPTSITTGVAISGMTITGGRDTGQGGGIQSAGNLTLTNVHVTGNQAIGNSGGGVALLGADGVFTNCTFSGNTAFNQGGGINYLGDGGHTLRLVNSTVSGNTVSSGPGGGIINFTTNGISTLTVVNSTITGNTSTLGGGIRTSAFGTTATTTLRNTIIANNSLDNLSSGTGGTVASQGFNLSDNFNGVFTLTTGDITTATPRLAPLALYGGQTPTLALLHASPAINAGDASGQATDQRGVARVFGATADIGAVEMRPLVVTSTANAGAGSLRNILGGGGNAPLTDIQFENGLFSTPQTITLTGGELGINFNANIIAPGADLLTVSGNNQSRVFQVFPTITATLSGMRITGGNTNGDGGGIYNDGTLTVNSVVVSNNNLSGFSGGGIGNGSGDSLTVNNSTISGNTGGLGGGIFDDGTLTIINSTISGNTSTNSLVGGGGILKESGTATVTNSTISGNTASGSGGGIFNNNATVTVTNSTIAGNTAGSSNGGGAYFNNFGTFNLKNAIIANNLAPNSANKDVRGTVASQGYNLLGNSTGATITGTTTGNQLDVNPLLGTLQNNGGTTATHALLAGSTALDRGNSSGSTSDQRGLARPVDLAGISNFPNSDGADIGALEAQTAPVAQNRAPFDYDGDNKTDISIFRPGPGEWWVLRSSNGSNFATQFGSSTDRLVPADFTGDGKADIAFWRPSNGNWFVLRSEDLTFFAFPFGANGDKPVPADYDGDNKADAAVFRESSLTWFISKSSGGTDIIGFGAAGDKPVIADYDGDAKADIAIFRPVGASGSEWWIRRSSNASVFATQFGTSTDRPVQGDYTGDGKTDVAFWRPSNGNWFVLRSEDFSFFAFPFGTSGDVPVPGDYDGDGRSDAGVFRPSNFNWFIQRSTAGTLIQQFGIANDIPTPSAYIP